jgi:LAGLIDADG endonuclease
MVVYTVDTFIELPVIIDHFNQYPLVTAKVCDFLLFKQCFEIIKEKKHLTQEGLYSLVGLRSSLN